MIGGRPRPRVKSCSTATSRWITPVTSANGEIGQGRSSSGPKRKITRCSYRRWPTARSSQCCATLNYGRSPTAGRRSRKARGDFAAVDAQVGVMSRDITHPETMPVGSQNVGATAADPPDPVEQRPTRMAARRIVMRKIPDSRHSRPRFRKDLTAVRATGPYRSSWRKSKPGFEMRIACRLCRLKAHVSNRYFSVQRGDPARARNVVT